jgi:hypothetical protein
MLYQQYHRNSAMNTLSGKSGFVNTPQTRVLFGFGW